MATLREALEAQGYTDEDLDALPDHMLELEGEA